MEKIIVEKLLQMNKKALKNDDVPVSCVIVKENKIIASAYNKKKLSNDPLAHAEILAIKIAAKKLKSYNLSDCELYVSLKPCNMCKEVIKEARIKKVYYILNNEKIINDTVKYEQMSTKYEHLFNKELVEFFVNKR